MTLNNAQSLLSLIKQSASDRNQSVAAAVVDDHGELIAFIKMDDCSFQASLLAQNKAYTAARDRQPTSNLGSWAKEMGKDLNYWTDPRITGFSGGLPIYLGHNMIGAIGVSGLSEVEDETLAQQAIHTFTAKNHTVTNSGNGD